MAQRERWFGSEVPSPSIFSLQFSAKAKFSIAFPFFTASRPTITDQDRPAPEQTIAHASVDFAVVHGKFTGLGLRSVLENAIVAILGTGEFGQSFTEDFPHHLVLL